MQLLISLSIQYDMNNVAMLPVKIPIVNFKIQNHVWFAGSTYEEHASVGTVIGVQFATNAC